MEMQISSSTDWDHLLLFSPPNHQSPLSVDDIEQLLFNDEEDADQLDNDDAFNCDRFLHDILLDSPSPLEEEGHKSGEVFDEPPAAAATDQKEDDPLAKKRKRQLRNRDAAVRSRERKKMHVKDLEMKSRYYEGECKRLGSLLHWYMAENQALRFSLQNNTSSSNAATLTKQESAVLFLESLLLGSLLWLMGIIVAVLPSLVLLLLVLQTQLVTAEEKEEKHLPTLALKTVGGSRTTRLVGKRFKASRSRMRRFLQAVSSNIIILLLPVF